MINNIDIDDSFLKTILKIQTTENFWKGLIYSNKSLKIKFIYDINNQNFNCLEGLIGEIISKNNITNEQKVERIIELINFEYENYNKLVSEKNE